MYIKAYRTSSRTHKLWRISLEAMSSALETYALSIWTDAWKIFIQKWLFSRNLDNTGVLLCDYPQPVRRPASLQFCDSAETEFEFARTCERFKKCLGDFNCVFLFGAPTATYRACVEFVPQRIQFVNRIPAVDCSDGPSHPRRYNNLSHFNINGAVSSALPISGALQSKRHFLATLRLSVASPRSPFTWISWLHTDVLLRIVSPRGSLRYFDALLDWKSIRNMVLYVTKPAQKSNMGRFILQFTFPSVTLHTVLPHHFPSHQFCHFARQRHHRVDFIERFTTRNGK